MGKYDFFKTTMPASRIADYYLGYMDSSVFIDLNLNIKGQVYLQRISFDGYGCCNLDGNAKCLDYKSSKTFIDEIEKDSLDQKKITKLVLELIRLNKENIWTDALKEYELIDNE